MENIGRLEVPKVLYQMEYLRVEKGRYEYVKALALICSFQKANPLLNQPEVSERTDELGRQRFGQVHPKVS